MFGSYGGNIPSCVILRSRHDAIQGIDSDCSPRVAGFLHIGGFIAARLTGLCRASGHSPAVDGGSQAPRKKPPSIAPFSGLRGIFKQWARRYADNEKRPL
jgi:hypothetical protein